MKRHFIRAITLLAFSSILLSSCSVEYRERHRRIHDERHDHNDHHDDHDHHYYKPY